MKAYVGLTDWDWFQFLGTRRELDEVNFWRPSNTRRVSLEPGTPFLFKLHKGHGGAIVGFGVFAAFTASEMWAAWDAFGRKNGADSFSALHRMLAKIRATHGHESDPSGNFRVGCLMITQPVFFEAGNWVRPPSDWPATGLMGGKSIDITHGEGERVWNDCLARAREFPLSSPGVTAVIDAAAGHARYGKPVLVRPRLGQGTFAMVVTDAYGRACAVTREHSRPVLEAAHIRPYSEDGPHEVGNGLLLRTDIHRLFDKGYVTISPDDKRFVVGRKLKDDYENGRTYYALHGTGIHLPEHSQSHPQRSYLEWHSTERFKG